MDYDQIILALVIIQWPVSTWLSVRVWRSKFDVSFALFVCLLGTGFIGGGYFLWVIDILSTYFHGLRNSEIEPFWQRTLFKRK